MITPDKIFSYWIYVWFLLYYIIYKTGTVKSVFIQYANPTIMLYFALIENIVSLILIFLSTFDFSITILYTIMLFLLKVLPIYLLKDAPINILQNILISIILFVIYLAYLKYRGKSALKIYTNIYESIIKKENKTPFFRIYTFLQQVF